MIKNISFYNFEWNWFPISFKDVEDEKILHFLGNGTALESAGNTQTKVTTEEEQTEFLFNIYQAISKYMSELRKLQHIQRDDIRYVYVS